MRKPRTILARPLHTPVLTMRLVAATLLLALTACVPGKGKAVPARLPADMKSIDSVDAHPNVIDPPPMLTDEGPAPKPKVNLAQADAPPPPTAQDDAMRAALPFAPAIAMDPVDGSKISIRANTPTFEVKGKIYYFQNEENKKVFVATPDEFMKGLFSHL